jgi:hypothetical protein
MAEYLKSQTPQELWKAALKPEDPLKPKDPFKLDATADVSSTPVVAAKAAGTGLLIDTLA